MRVPGRQQRREDRDFNAIRVIKPNGFGNHFGHPHRDARGGGGLLHPFDRSA